MRQQLLMRHLDSVSMRIDASIAELNHLKSTIQWLKSEIPESFKPKIEANPAIETRSNDDFPDRPTDLIRIKEVMKMTGLSRSTIYKYVNDSIFPEPVNLGARSVAWRRGHIHDWIKDRC